MDDLLIKYLLDEASPDEIARVEQWLHADVANRARFEQFRAVWVISRRTATAPVLQDAQAAWKELRHRLNRSANGAASSEGRTTVTRATITGTKPLPTRTKLMPTRTKLMPTRTKLMPLHWRIAAVFAGILFLGAGGYLIISKPGPRATTAPVAIAPPPAPAKEETFPAVGQPQTVTLPDQSVVTLNRRTLLSYSQSAGEGPEARGLTVRLRGEAFFSIAHHPDRPFVVQVNDVRIKVLGTSFEVRGATGQGSATAQGGTTGQGSGIPQSGTEVVVETGAVRVTYGADSMVVHAGEKIIVQPNHRLKKQAMKDRLYGYYLGRPLVCDSVPLRRLVQVLNEAYDAHLSIGRPQLNDLPLTTVFRHDQSLDRILSVIAATFDLTIVRQGQSIILQ